MLILRVDSRGNVRHTRESHSYQLGFFAMFTFETFFKRLILFALCLQAFPVTLGAQQPASPLVESFERYQQMKSDTTYGLQWVSVGPLVNSARVEAVQLDPTRPGTMYVAFGSGGLWKTTNNGMSWNSIFEGHASYGIGDIALAPSDPNIIYLGTGESLKKARNFTIPGCGVYRSDDGGNNWRHLGLNDSWHISEIAVHPTNPDIALVAVLGHFWSSNKNRGLFRTKDGGKTWEHVLQVSEHVGANDVVWSYSDPDVVYASTWENYPDVNGTGSSVYASRDAGRTWEKCENGFPSGEKIGRIGLAVSYTDENKVYALVDNRSQITEGAAEVFKSTDGGQTWSRTHQDNLMIFSRIGWYFADIYVNPQNDEEIFALGVRVAHSTDGGKSFELIGGDVTHLVPSAASGLHLDHCEMWINPTNPEHVVLGNDGGLYQSYDKGKSWLHLNNLPTGEFYDIAVDQNSPCIIYAGAQDDATVYGQPFELGPSRTEPWKYLWIDPWNGGDGCISQVDPTDSNTVYWSAQEGAFRRKDMTTNRSKPIKPRLPRDHEGDLRFNFVAPMIISPHNSNTLYLAGNYVFKSTNRGDDWNVISDDLAQSNDSQRKSIAVGAIAESPRVQGLIYAGTDKGAFWVSEDDGNNWHERSGQLPAGYIRSICPSRHRDSRVYIAITGINYDDLDTHLYSSEDRGVTWKSISSIINDEPANVIFEDPTYENVLYAGTFRGVYISTNRGHSWSLLGRNLPACSVSDIDIHRQSKQLIVATHGRGIYTMNLAPLYQHIENPIYPENDVHLYPIPVAVRPYISDTRTGINFRPFEKTPITFWLDKSRPVEITISNEDDQPLTSIKLDGTKGLNQFHWDLVIKSNTSPQPYFINYKQHLDVGNYRIQFKTSNSESATRPFTVTNIRTPD